MNSVNNKTINMVEKEFYPILMKTLNTFEYYCIVRRNIPVKIMPVSFVIRNSQKDSLYDIF